MPRQVITSLTSSHMGDGWTGTDYLQALATAPDREHEAFVKYSKTPPSPSSSSSPSFSYLSYLRLLHPHGVVPTIVFPSTAGSETIHCQRPTTPVGSTFPSVKRYWLFKLPALGSKRLRSFPRHDALQAPKPAEANGFQFPTLNVVLLASQNSTVQSPRVIKLYGTDF